MKKEFAGVDAPAQYHAFLRQYQAVRDARTSDSDRHIFYSRPTGKWIKATTKKGKIVVTFHDECPCSDPH